MQLVSIVGPMVMDHSQGVVTHPTYHKLGRVLAYMAFAFFQSIEFLDKG